MSRPCLFFLLLAFLPLTVSADDDAVRVGTHSLFPVSATVVDTDGEPVPDALVVALWPAKRYVDKYHGAGFKDIGPLAYAEALTDQQGRFRLVPVANAASLLPRAVSRHAPVIMVYKGGYPPQRFENAEGAFFFDKDDFPADRSSVWQLAHDVESEWNGRQLVLKHDADRPHGDELWFRHFELASGADNFSEVDRDDVLVPECITRDLPYFAAVIRVRALNMPGRSAGREAIRRPMPYRRYDVNRLSLPAGCPAPVDLLDNLDRLPAVLNDPSLHLRPPLYWADGGDMPELVITARVLEQPDEFSPPAPCDCRVRMRSEIESRNEGRNSGKHMVILETRNGMIAPPDPQDADSYFTQPVSVRKGQRIRARVATVMRPPAPQVSVQRALPAKKDDGG